MHDIRDNRKFIFQVYGWNRRKLMLSGNVKLNTHVQINVDDVSVERKGKEKLWMAR